MDLAKSLLCELFKEELTHPEKVCCTKSKQEQDPLGSKPSLRNKMCVKKNCLLKDADIP